MSSPRIIRAPRGTQLTCKNWLSEAAYRMIQNNLDPEVERVGGQVCVKEFSDSGSKALTCRIHAKI